MPQYYFQFQKIECIFLLKYLQFQENGIHSMLQYPPKMAYEGNNALLKKKYCNWWVGKTKMQKDMFSL